MTSSSSPAPTSRRRSLLYAVLVVFGYLIFAEVVARGLFVALSGSPLPLFYGFDRDIKFVAESTLLKPSFLRAGESRGGEPSAAAMHRGGRLVYAFGGSTTAGANCASDSSSWPAELAAAAPELEVVNFGLNGTNSDYAVGRLSAALGERVPDLVLWANWPNELDVVYEGPRRNRATLARRFGAYLAQRNEAFATGRRQTLLARLDRTLYETSGLYLLLSKAIDQFEHNARGRSERTRALTVEDRDFAIANTLLNLEAAEALARRRGFTLAVVRLPILWSRFERDYGRPLADFVRDWNKTLMAEVARYAAANGIPVLDLQGLMDGAADADVYCDSIHMVRAGHRRLAVALRGLMKTAGLLPTERGS